MPRRAAKPFADEADQITETVRRSPLIASDETSARVAGKTWWQWTFGAATAVYQTIVPTRGKCVPVDLTVAKGVAAVSAQQATLEFAHCTRH